MAQPTVVVVQPQGTQGVPQGSGLLVGNAKGHRDWTSGLFSCCQDFCGVCKVCLCMECTIWKLNRRVGECRCVHWLVPGALINLRTKVRTLGGIRGSMIYDCLVVSLCFPLAVCQIDRETRTMGL